MEYKYIKILEDRNTGYRDKPKKCWISPEGTYIVAEMHCQQFAIGKLVSSTGDKCTMRLLETYRCPDYDEDLAVLFSADVEWSWMRYGFFKIVSRNFDEMTTLAHRYYFNPGLYQREKHKLHPDTNP